MENLRANLLSILENGELPLVEAFEDYGGTEESEQEIKKTVFTSAAITLGDSREEIIDFTRTQERKEIEVDILLWLKTDQVKKVADTIVLEIDQLLFGNTLGLDTMITGDLGEYDGDPFQDTEEIEYITLTFRATLIESTERSGFYLRDSQGFYLLDSGGFLLKVSA